CVQSSGERLPACLRNAWNFARERQFAEANPAQGELAQISARPAATLATVPQANLEFRRLLFLSDFRCGCHEWSLSLLPEWHSHVLQQGQTLCVRFGRRRNAHIHAFQLFCSRSRGRSIALLTQAYNFRGRRTTSGKRRESRGREAAPHSSAGRGTRTSGRRAA